MMEKANVYSKIYRKKTIMNITKKCKMLGVNSKLNPIKFMNYRVSITALTFLLLFIFSDKGYIYAPLLSVVAYIGTEYYLDLKIKKRAEKLNYEAIFFFQVLVLSLESGKSLEGGIRLTCKSIDSEISDEFKRTLDEIKLGKSLIESLESMKNRIPSEEINTVLLNVTQSSIFGNNVIESLNNQIEYLRDKKILSIKAKINKMPMKISVISVVFIIPIVLLLVLGPVIVNFFLSN